MDISQAISGYITKMMSVGDPTSQGANKMKVLLLDRDTVRAWSDPPHDDEC
jgi:vacuolar protein sorting-associated protein 45